MMSFFVLHLLNAGHAEIAVTLVACTIVNNTLMS
jgi:hypothetical protein